MSQTSQWMALTLSSDGMITSLSPSVEQWTAYPAEDLLGKPVTFLISGGPLCGIPSMLRSACDTGKWNGEVTCRVRCADPLAVHAMLASLTGTSGQHAGFLLISTPYAGKTGSSEEVSRGEVSACLRGIAHQMNNPLAVMMGFAQLILSDSGCEGKLRDDVERLYAEMKRIVEVVQKLQAFAVSLQEENSEAAKKKPCVPAAACRNAGRAEESLASQEP